MGSVSYLAELVNNLLLHAFEIDAFALKEPLYLLVHFRARAIVATAVVKFLENPLGNVNFPRPGYWRAR